MVVCRVFHGRLKAMKNFLRQQFDGLAYKISVAEFQKQGLPESYQTPVEKPVLYELRFYMYF
jgi:hypothetical protein